MTPLQLAQQQAYSIAVDVLHSGLFDSTSKLPSAQDVANIILIKGDLEWLQSIRLNNSSIDQQSKGISCENCGSNPTINPKIILRRINPFGVTGKWICTECLDNCEQLNGRLHYFHSKDCPSFCDYACNGQKGFDLAEQVMKELKP